MSEELSIREIKNNIYHLRGKQVMLDGDLAILYQVKTKRLNEAVKRNTERFPSDFMFQLTKTEFNGLRSQFATSKRGGRQYLPYAFTEHGILMLSSVLKSQQAVNVNIQIMRAFVQMRRQALTIVELKRKIDTIESKYDKQFKVVFDALRHLIEAPLSKKKKGIGFTGDIQ